MVKLKITAGVDVTPHLCLEYPSVLETGIGTRFAASTCSHAAKQQQAQRNAEGHPGRKERQGTPRSLLGVAAIANRPQEEG